MRNYIQDARKIVGNMKNQLGEFDQDSIPGLCEKKDSCEQCRKARISYKPYIDYLVEKWFIDRLQGQIEVSSDLESRAKDEKERDSINMNFWGRFQERLKKVEKVT